MLRKLLRKSLTSTQIVIYLITLCTGFTIILLTLQLYFDIIPLLQNNSSLFRKNAVVINKNISLFKSIGKSKTAFSEQEIARIQEEEFIKNVAFFRNASFHVAAYIEESADIPLFYTDLFFESVPDEYLDIETGMWKWEFGREFIPVVIPEAYLNLYNFGFAESQNLPVISPQLISKVQFKIKLSGNGKSDLYTGQIVAFSETINSILVPDNFLQWANIHYGKGEMAEPGRLLVEFYNPTDERIAAFFKENNYSISQNDLEMSRFSFFTKLIFMVMILIAIIIILLSFFYIILSIKLIIERKRDTLYNLTLIGYKHTQIAHYFQFKVSIISLAAITIATIISLFIRQQYLSYFSHGFSIESHRNYMIIISFLSTFVLLFMYNMICLRTIKSINK